MPTLTGASWKINAAGTLATPLGLTGGEAGIPDVWNTIDYAGNVQVNNAMDMVATPTLSGDYMAHTKTMMAAMLAAGDGLNAITVADEGQVLVVGNDFEYWDLTDCVPNSAEVSWAGPAGDAAVQCSFSWLARMGARTEGAYSAVSLPAGARQLRAGDITVTDAGDAGDDVKCIGFRLTVERNWEAMAWAVARSVGEARFCQGFRKHVETLTLEITRNAPISYDAVADSPSHAIAVVITVSDGTTTTTFTYSNLGRHPQPVVLRALDDGTQDLLERYHVPRGALAIT